jgi:hypothetical protein
MGSPLKAKAQKLIFHGFLSEAKVEKSIFYGFASQRKGQKMFFPVFHIPIEK